MPFRPLPVLTGDTATDLRAIYQYLSTLVADVGGVDLRVPASLTTLSSSSSLIEQLRLRGLLSLADSSIFGDFAIPDVPAIPSGLTAVGFATFIGLSWNLSLDPTIKGYELQRADDAAFTINVVTRTRAKALSFVDGEFDGAVTRYYRLRAIRDDGTFSDWTTVVSATTAGLGALALQDGSVTTSKLADGSVATVKIGAGQVTTVKIGDAQVTQEKIQDGAISTAKIGDQQVTTTKIGDTSVTQVKMASGLRVPVIVSSLPALPDSAYPQGATVVLTTDNKLYRSTGTAWTVAVPTVDLTGQITSGQITDQAVTTAKLADGSVATVKIGDGQVTTVTIADANVTQTKIQDGAISTAKIGDQQVTTTKIGDSTITQVKMASGLRVPVIVSTLPALPDAAYPQGATVVLTTDNKLYRSTGSTWTVAVPTVDLTGQITNAQITDGAVTTVKIGDSQVTTTKLNDASVVTAKIGDSQITAQKLGDGSVTLLKFGTGLRPVEIVSSLPGQPYTQGATVFLTTDSKLYRSTGSAWTVAVPTVDLTGQITGGQITDGAVTTVKLGDAQVTEQKLSDGSVTTTKIGDAQVTNTKLGTGSVTTIKIGDQQITVDKLADGSVSKVKFGTGLRPVEVLGALPGLPDSNYPQGAVVFLTTDNKLYRSTGSTWTVAVPTADLSGTITETQITDGAITTPKIGANQVTAAKIAVGTITANEIAADTILAGNIAAGAITSSELGTGAVIAGKIAALTIVAGDIAANTITGGKIAAGTIAASNIQAGTITSAEIAADTILAGNIAAGAVTSSELATGAVIAGKIAALTIVAGDIAAGTITGDKIAAGTITASNIQAATITSAQIAADTIVAGNIAAGAVASSELATGAVVAGKIAALTIVAGDIAAATITGDKIAAATIAGSNIVADTIVAGNIAAGAIGADELATGAVVAGKIAALTIVAGDIAAATITVGKLALNTLDSTVMRTDVAIITTAAQIANALIQTAHIVDANITTAKIGDAQVVTAKIADAQITSLKILDGAITTAKILDANVTNAKIDSLTASKITAGNIVATLDITTGLLRTAASGRRVEVDSVGIRAYDSGGVKKFDLNASTGEIATVTTGLLTNTAGDSKFDLTNGLLRIKSTDADTTREVVIGSPYAIGSQGLGWDNADGILTVAGDITARSLTFLGRLTIGSYIGTGVDNTTFVVDPGMGTLPSFVMGVQEAVSGSGASRYWFWKGVTNGFNVNSSTDGEQTNAEVGFGGVSWDILRLVPGGIVVGRGDGVTKHSNVAGSTYDLLLLRALDNKWVGRIKIVGYTGNGGTSQAITGVGFNPDIVIISTDANDSFGIIGRTPSFVEVTANGTGYSSRYVSESALGSLNGIWSADSDGFTVGNNADVNQNAKPYKALCIQASQASLTGKVRHFTYRGNGSSPRTITVEFQADWAMVWRAFPLDSTTWFGFLRLPNMGLNNSKNMSTRTVGTTGIRAVGATTIEVGSDLNLSNVMYEGLIFANGA